MELKSPDFENNGLIPSRFTCDGENVNPTLDISGVPSDAQSLVLVMDDPDAPHGTWVHWLVWNIDPNTERIVSGSIPADAIEGMTDFGRPGYGGPCPPSGTHRYFFKLYALDTKLDLASTANSKELLESLRDHIIATAELIGLYAKEDK
jgi:hypothetical protein